MKLSIKTTKVLAALLAIWLYTFAYKFILERIWSNGILLYYGILLCITVLVLLLRRKTSKRLILYLLTYILFAFINILVVRYSYYVMIEAFSAFFIFLPALLIIGSSNFFVDYYIRYWYIAARIHSVMLPFFFLLYVNKIVNYGIFTYVCIPNAVIFSYYIFLYDQKIGMATICFAAVNSCVALLFGGRMAGLICIITYVYAFLMSNKISLIKKLIFTILCSVSVIIVIRYVREILLYIYLLLKKYNLGSRTLWLYLKSPGTNKVYSSGRDNIYPLVLRYIKERFALPGGFGVVLNLSQGQYYHPHNLILQLVVLLGGLGALIFIFSAIFRMLKLKTDKNLYFLLLLIYNFLTYSLTGTSILDNSFSIMIIGLLYFYQNFFETQGKKHVDD